MNLNNKTSWFLGIATFLTFGLSGGAAPGGSSPILFAHEYCSAASSWDSMFQQLPKRRFGVELVRVSQAGTGIMNTSALAGANFGEGRYTCRMPITGTTTWQATQSGR